MLRASGPRVFKDKARVFKDKTTTEADKDHKLSLPGCRFHFVASTLSLPRCRFHVVASTLLLVVRELTGLTRLPLFRDVTSL